MFRPLRPDDKALFYRWLDEPHIGGWWGAPDEQWAHILNHWAEKPAQTSMHIVQINGADFAYVQSYNAHSYPASQYADRPIDAQAMDSFLGDPAYLGQGHGTGFIRTRAQQLLAVGASVVLVDPDVLNTHAIGSYTRAGFIPVEERLSQDGTQVLVMEFKGSSPEGLT